MTQTSSPFEPFGDVVRNGERSTLELVTQTALAPEGRLRAHGVGRQRQFDTGLPDWKLLKPFVTHRKPLESGIWNLESAQV